MQIIARRILFAIAILAAVPAAAGQIGFLDSERAIKTVKEGQRQMQILDDWSNRRADEVEALRDRANEIARQINVQRAVSPAETVLQLESELLQAQRALEDAGRALKRDFEAKQKELLDQVVTRMRELTREYAAANGFDAVFMFETTPLVYVSDSVIITDAVIQLYDERYPID